MHGEHRASSNVLIHPTAEEKDGQKLSFLFIGDSKGNNKSKRKKYELDFKQTELNYFMTASCKDLTLTE